MRLSSPRQVSGVDEEFPRKLSNKNREVKENDITDITFCPKLLDIWDEMR